MMRIKNYKIAIAFTITCLVICVNTIGGHAQVLPGLQKNFTAWQKANLHEKIYVHTNKSFYLTGEIIWFKIYNTDGSTNKLLDLSKVVYVELLDNNHNAVMQAKISMTGGVGNGSLLLPFSISNGNYQLRAYTNWMKNFDAGYFFEKQLTIVNPVKISPVQTQPMVTGYDVQFFPEGGHLVKGLESKLAFKVTAADGRAPDCSGVVVDDKKDTVVRFKSLKFGIGSFKFTPLKRTGYKAVIKFGTNSIVKELPEISETGYVIQATDHNESWNVSVKCSDNKAATDLYIIAHSPDTINLIERATLVDGTANISINKNKLGDGISYITLFDDHERPLCERLIFKKPANKLDINAGVDQPLYSRRKKVSLTIAARNEDNKNLNANLSVSVFRTDSLQNDDASHIAAYLWLCADLKGHIESPDYYLENNNEETDLALDNLMLSQGWTQFNWNKILDGETPQFTFLPEFTGPLISGNMVNKLNNSPAKNIMAYLTIAGTNHQLYVTKSDSSGKLLFNTKGFYGLNEIVAQTNWQHDSTYRIDIASPFSEQYSQTMLPAFNVAPALKNALINNSLNMQVQNIFAEKQQKQFYAPPADSVVFYSKPTYTYKLDDYTRFPTVEEVVHEYVTSIVITRERGKRGLQVIHNKAILPGEPLVMLDGRPFFNIDKAFLIDPLKVKRLDVITTDYLYGPVVFNGILSFTTYAGNSNNIELDPRSVVMDYEGLQLERKFYAPVYDTEQQISSSIPDFRTALYWNPEVNTDENGQCILNFYTGDKPGKYIGIIEGIAANGSSGSGSFYFEVKK